MKYFIIILLVGLIMGCSNPMDEKITRTNYHQLIEKIKTKSSEDDRKKVAALVSLYKMGSIFSGQDEISLLEGKSFNEHIALFNERMQKEAAEAKEQEIKEAKEKEEKDKALAEENKRVEELTKKFEFSNYKKSTWESEYGIKRYLEIKLDVKNISEADIDAFEGWMTVYDKLDNKLARFYLKSTKLLRKGSVGKIETSRELNLFDSDDRVFEVKNTDLKDLKVKFSIEKVVNK